MTNAEPLPGWLSENFSSLVSQYRAGSLGHAVLLAGQAGIGKALLLEHLTAALVCEKDGAEACGQCRCCVLLAAGNYPDLMRLAPAEKKTQIGIDQVRALLEQVHKTAQIGGGKIVQIAPAEAMNRNASNAILKCLEEPPENTYFLLLSEAPARLPATVRSRCQLQRLPSPDQAQAIDYLKGQAIKDVERRLAICPGQPLLAIRDGEALQALDDAVQKAMLAHLAAPLSLVNTAKQLQALNPVALAGAWLRIVRELIKVGLGLPSLLLCRELSELALSPSLASKALLDHAEGVQKNLYSLHAGSNLNEQLLAEQWLHNFAGCITHPSAD